MHINKLIKKFCSSFVIYILIAAINFSATVSFLGFNAFGGKTAVYADENDSYGYVPGRSGKIETRDGTVIYSFPDSEDGYTSNHVYIRLTLSTTADNMFFINPDGYNASVCWNGDYGVIHSWNEATAFPESQRTYETVKGWGNVSCWKDGKQSVTVTYDLNRAEKILKIFSDSGAGYTCDMVNDNSTKITLKYISGTTEVTKVEFGEVLSNMITISDADGNPIDDITGAIGQTLYITAYGKTEEAEEVAVLYGIYDADKRCIAADIKRVKVNDGSYHVTLLDKFTTVVPQNANSVKLFTWVADSLAPIADNGYMGRFPEDCEVRQNTTVYFDDEQYVCDVVLLNEYPLVKLSNLAEIIGGSCDSSTVTKDGVSVTYSANSRLAESGDGHIMLETSVVKSGGNLYVPVSSLMPTLGYSVFYNRFADEVEITTGTAYPKSQRTIYVKDYGAKGDGVTDDGPAITHAVNAAVNSGVPTTVELESDKTYLIGERADYLQYFHLEDAENLTIDGKNSELVFERCTNTFLKLDSCTNVTVKNLKVDYAELPFTQGVVSNINSDDGTFEMEIDEGYPLPATDEWVYNYWTNSRTGKWWFGQFMDPVEDRLKFTMYDNYFIDSVKKIDDGRYLLTAKDGYKSRLSYIDSGDRFVLNTRFSAYDIGDYTSDGTTSMIEVWESGDITFDNVNLYASPGLGVSVGLCWGRVRFNRFGEETKPGRLLCVNSDGIHYWRNRCGITVENSKFMNSLDDHINTKGEDAEVMEKIDDYTYVTDYDLNYRVGDELIFFDGENHNTLEKVFLKNIEKADGKFTLTLDRPVYDTVEKDNADGTRATIIYDIDSSGRGSVIRNNTFIYSRRHAYISRSQNSVFENNTVTDCGGSALAAENEIMSASSEGPFPSSFTMRNNTVVSKGTTYGYYPIEVKSWKATVGNTKAIDGFLIEGNTVDVPNKYRAISIESVKDLYMINNTVKCGEALESSTMPIYITNCDIALIDGIDFDYAQNVNTVVTINQSNVNTDNIKNINTNGNTASPYKIN